jgi:hypothetical protein
MDRTPLVIPLVVASLWIAVPVEARHTQGSCPQGTGCIWDETDFRGRKGQVPRSGCIDSRIRSAVNNSDGVLEFFMGAGCYGLRTATLQPGQEAPDLKAGSAAGDCTLGPADPCSDQPPSPAEPSPVS